MWLTLSVLFFFLSDFLLWLHALVIDPSYGALWVAQTSCWFVSDSDFSGDITNPARLLVLLGEKKWMTVSFNSSWLRKYTKYCTVMGDGLVCIYMRSFMAVYALDCSQAGDLLTSLCDSFASCLTNKQRAKEEKKHTRYLFFWQIAESVSCLNKVALLWLLN